MTATDASPPGTPHRIDFVDEDDARRVLLGLLEHVTDTAGADTHKHFHKVGAGNTEERHLGLARNGLGQQRLTGTRRAHHQYTAGNLATQTLELGRVTQEFDQLLHFFLGFFHARHIGEGSLDLVFAQQFGLGLAERHGATAATTAALHLAHEENEDGQDQQNRQYGQEQLGQETLTLRLQPHHIDVVLNQGGHQVGVQGRRFHRTELATIRVGPGNRAFADFRFLHLAVFYP